MKKLNITKERFNTSKYFQTKYGKLEYVSESGKVYKTSKGRILKFNENAFGGYTPDELEDELNRADIEDDDKYGFIVTYKSGNVTGFTREGVNDGVCSYEEDIVKVEIKDVVKRIGHSAFSHCTGLKSVTIPNSVKSIGNGAFSRCTSLESVIIPNGVIEIGGWAFNECNGLKSVTIPNSVKSIGCCAFSNCTSLKSVTIPRNCDVGKSAFPDTCEVIRK